MDSQMAKPRTLRCDHLYSVGKFVVRLSPALIPAHRAHLSSEDLGSLDPSDHFQALR